MKVLNTCLSLQLLPWRRFMACLLDDTFTNKIDHFTDYDGDSETKFQSIFMILRIQCDFVRTGESGPTFPSPDSSSGERQRRCGHRPEEGRNSGNLAFCTSQRNWIEGRP